MKIFKNACILIFVSLLFAACGSNKEKKTQEDFLNDGQEQEAPGEMPVKKDWVNDYEGLYSAQEVDSLRQLIVDYEQATTNEIYILTIDDINPYDDLTNYSDALFNVWQPGKKDKDNGMIFVISRELGELRIVNGSDYDKSFTNDECHYIINQIIIPYFMNSEYYKGTKQGIIETINTIENE